MTFQSCSPVSPAGSRLAKERQAEDHLFGDKDRFVTAAYKKKLEEDKKWLAEEKLREELEARDDVVKKGHMGDFYRYIRPQHCLTAEPGTAVCTISW